MLRFSYGIISSYDFDWNSERWRRSFALNQSAVLEIIHRNESDSHGSCFRPLANISQSGTGI